MKWETKEELVAYMKASREIHHPSKESEAWKRAFEIYESEGNPADMDCSSCWRRVSEWLNR